VQCAFCHISVFHLTAKTTYLFKDSAASWALSPTYKLTSETASVTDDDAPPVLPVKGAVSPEDDSHPSMFKASAIPDCDGLIFINRMQLTRCNQEQQQQQLQQQRRVAEGSVLARSAGNNYSLELEILYEKSFAAVLSATVV
jgi:hypothetical protein